jgi:hypothetical protein
MKKVLLLTAVLLLTLTVTVGFAQTTYTGTLGTGTGAVSSQMSYGGSTWEGSSYPTLSWTVTGSGSAWNYTYTLNDNYSDCPTLPYMLLETSTTFTSSDISNMLGGTDSVGTYTSGTYTGLPRSLYGLLLTPTNTGTNDFTVEFNSDRAPVWGDFYAMGSQTPNDYAWNSGFLSNDPDPAQTGPANGALDITSGSYQGYYLLIPDTTGSSGSAPEPGSLGLGLCALGLAVGVVRRRKAAKQSQS